MERPLFEHHHEHAEAIVHAVLTAVEPRSLTRRALAQVEPPEGPVSLIAFGKASVKMTMAAAEHVADRIRFGIVAAVPTAPRPAGFPPTVGLLPADHPLPTDLNVEAASAIRFVAADFGRTRQQGVPGHLMVLISGGGSAHLTLPAEGLTLSDLRTLTDALLRSGASIAEINCVRKHCEQLKGGRLAQLASPGPVSVFVLSDVVGDALDVVASGPCAPDPTTYADALAVLELYQLRREAPRVWQHLEDGRDGVHPETPKPDEEALAHVQSRVVANNDHAVRAAVAACEMLGFHVARSATRQTQAVHAAVTELAGEIRQIKKAGPRPAAVVLGGEMTVPVRGQGVGGRNQELALALACELDAVTNVAILAFATDGIDGPTDAAGAVVCGRLAGAAGAMGLDPRAALRNNDSHTFFLMMDAHGHRTLIRTGPTGTNVNDVVVAMIY